MPGKAGVRWEWDGEQHPAVGTGTPGHPKTLLDTHPLFAFLLYCQALPFPHLQRAGENICSSHPHCSWVSRNWQDPIPLERDGQSQSPRQHPPSASCPDPSSSSLQSRRSVASQLIASTHVCKLTVYWKMSRNVNFIRNVLPFFYDGK